jgi:hypothetical protein
VWLIFVMNDRYGKEDGEDVDEEGTGTLVGVMGMLLWTSLWGLANL